VRTVKILFSRTQQEYENAQKKLGTSISDFNQCLQDLGLTISISTIHLISCLTLQESTLRYGIFRKHLKTSSLWDKEVQCSNFVILRLDKLLDWLYKDDPYRVRHEEIQGLRASKSGSWFQKEVGEWIQGPIVPFFRYGSRT
jgi:hypothetical protein